MLTNNILHVNRTMLHIDKIRVQVNNHDDISKVHLNLSDMKGTEVFHYTFNYIMSTRNIIMFTYMRLIHVNITMLTSNILTYYVAC